MGTLYIVSTPIGNLKDITLRAIETLKEVDYILCEDTRITGKLLSAYKINQEMVVFNDFNENRKTPEIIGDLLKGKKIALVSDAGTPLISDPGYKLVRSAIENNIKVESISGQTAVISALTVSGQPPDKFLFFGYLPKKEGRRRKLLADISSIVQTIKLTVVFFESPYRLIDTLKDIQSVFGNIDIVVLRELTKIHEEVRHEKVTDSIEHFLNVKPKGEFTILF
ncbi:16S rRNA (cytidine(1402)-2'-O)-methyltransferase [Candidatus Curtissbacteria bacterium RIFCSPHIGHO2_01_FULL_41_44]|uniref:Ribosomal RNA small subunit methyltransferase I n=1 Tax=Candidatus Curtissbacteria bacterium RIFCSPLOWO2_01_FULL_42_50 TaxID=1797730 RepID=A0A1F5H448_9BACT|nr:MAG: 16S rRNA (cytidine(1402)-2'-O)-methyltransferase [Candidatus Curtissbacteria bacterium RIFCSPHIGHO2_01_FULL_41_44]OGD93236.1 MAG: 16S rRNA (cytidine(1402)-2'-O)-methyltransferase [Candidatus Curtissbacteria bacterium RIFCSPHIGHO2_02_FULL_42_58]OGD96876.1 MAG: 16S rRNA (cytidine(1402)-2'-O)-methyltransferase [Candidatus Curtissbacteria bacterium RIFCSPHIGHO2_12_FULL_42_33]OGD98940.1 MAG: 16S rRNA (cytidine(1402)-2'-O)-methyltransferase [Candidatus Curtissbacteria bacterium RIFCSPLOWO2_01_